MSPDEYRARFEAIQETKSLTDASEILGIGYSALSKWYHEHREEFSPSIREAIKNNSGRKPLRSRVTTPRVVEESKTQEVNEQEPHPSGNLVDALFERFSRLKHDNERLLQENNQLREEIAKLRGHLSARSDIQTRSTREKLKIMLEDVAANSLGSQD